MTVETTEAFVVYVGDGSTVDFVFEFPSFDPAWMYGIVDLELESGSAVLNEDQDSNPGGLFTFDIAPILDAQVVVARAADTLQGTDYQPFTRFPAKDHETALDKLTMICQQLQFAIRGVVAGGDGGIQPPALFVLKTGDMMTGQLETIVPVGTGDATNKLYVDTADQALQLIVDGKAEASVAITTPSPETLTITSPTLADDVVIDTRTDVPDGLVTLNSAGFIDADVIPPTGTIFVFLGVFDASPNILPPDADETGEAFLIVVPGTLNLFEFSTEVQVPIAVVQGDIIVWISDPNPGLFPEGWYYVPFSAIPIFATNVIVDDTLFFFTSGTTQETFDISMPLLDTVIALAAANEAQLAINTPAIVANTDQVALNTPAIGINTSNIALKANLAGGNTFTGTNNFNGPLNVQDAANALRSANWRPREITQTGVRNVISADIGNTIRIVGASTLNVPAALGANGDLINVVSSGDCTVAGTGGVAIHWYQGDGNNTIGTRSVDTFSVFTLYRQSSTVWIIYGNGIS